MPSSRRLISSQTLTTTAPTVTFSSIPAGYTDLILKVSVRDNFAANGFSLRLSFNADGTANYNWIELYARGTSATSGEAYNQSGRTDFYATNGNNDTANTFSNAEIYIPSYRVSQSKPMGGFGVSENNSSTGNVVATTANLWRNNAAITSVTFTALGNYVAGSSFYLYGLLPA